MAFCTEICRCPTSQVAQDTRTRVAMHPAIPPVMVPTNGDRLAPSNDGFGAPMVAPSMPATYGGGGHAETLVVEPLVVQPMAVQNTAVGKVVDPIQITPMVANPIKEFPINGKEHIWEEPQKSAVVFDSSGAPECTPEVIGHKALPEVSIDLVQQFPDPVMTCFMPEPTKEAPINPPRVTAKIKEPADIPQDPEEEAVIKYSKTTECRKAALANLFVGLVFFGGLGFIKYKQGEFLEPFCDAKAKKSARCCDICSNGQMLTPLPLGGEWELSWSEGARACCYLAGLLWCFLGVGIVCDKFMESIEEITSAEKIVWRTADDGGRQKVRMPVWNGTIANLTLMALGSSAPEILLSFIELYKNDFYAGELGPSTIVGSAAFNLLVITAVCVVAIPPPEIRKVLRWQVFACTAFFSVFAYLWLYIMIQAWTPNLVSPTEALISFLLFPLLLALSYSIDKGMLCPGQKSANEGPASQEVENMMREISKTCPKGKEVTMEQVANLVDRQNALRQTTGPSPKARRRKSIFSTKKKGAGDNSAFTSDWVIGFKYSTSVCLESQGSVTLHIAANRPTACAVSLGYFTTDGTARAGVRYTGIEGCINFEANQQEARISIPIIDTDTWEPEEEFYVDLHELEIDSQSSVVGRIGTQRATVVILNDDEPGTLGFVQDEVEAIDGQTIVIDVTRTKGTCGDIVCHYKTENGTAIAGRDYEEATGYFEMFDGQTRHSIEINVYRNTYYEGNERFKLILCDGSPGIKFKSAREGDDACAICDILVLGNSNRPFIVRCLTSMCNLDKWTAGGAEYLEQLRAAFWVNGSGDDQFEAPRRDWLFHMLGMPWKLLFSALVPPACLAGGWLCFSMALLCIGIVTAFIGDIASLLACCLGISEDIAAISLVALGTSLPDTFASRTAALQEDTADNSVGNVTGSNSVNVFLGLGLPWTFCAFYWQSQGVTTEWLEHEYKGKTYRDLYTADYPDGGFIVPAGNLGFSVGVFTSTAVVCLCVLFVRRRIYGGELGGTKWGQMRDATFLGSLWLIYLGASIWNSSTSN